MAVKRMGDVDSLSREFASEHSGRLWKQLVLQGEDEAALASRAAGWRCSPSRPGAAVVGPDLHGSSPGSPTTPRPGWARNLGLLVLPFLAGWFGLRRRTSTPRPGYAPAVPFVATTLGGATSTPTTPTRPPRSSWRLHLPVVLWSAVAYPYMGGTLRSHERRMDFVRFTGEWFIYYVLIALGGGVLVGLTALILEADRSTDLAEQVIEWVLPSGGPAR